MDTRPSIVPNPPRWQPNPTPEAIHVPGLDTTAPVHEQIEQIEQLITIKLQNIDENFSKVHNLLATKILPAVKRYATGTEPVREAAKFWTAFYEQAAQIHIPTYDEYSTVNEQPSAEQETSQNTPSESATSSSGAYTETTITSTEHSFMSGQALYASTPATVHRNRTVQARDSLDSTNSDPSWTISMESPMVRLDREIQNFSLEDEDAPPLRADKGKGKEVEPLLRNVLRNNTIGASPIPKPKAPKNLNPYLPANTKPSEWNGLVDLARTPLSTPLRRKKAALFDDEDEEDSFDGLPEGMSPPVLMSAAKPPRSSAELARLKLGQTPTKTAAARITRDLVSDFQRQSARKMFGYEKNDGSSTMTIMSSPPRSFSRYAHDTGSSIAIDSSLESMMKRVGLSMPPSGSTPGLRLKNRSEAHSAQSQPQAPVFLMQEPDIVPQLIDDERDDFDDSDSLDDEEINIGQPSAAFLMASRGGGQRSMESDADEDSFGSSDGGGSIQDEGVAPVNPFAGTNSSADYSDESFDIQDDSLARGETLFGLNQARPSAGEDLQILGQDLLEDTIGARDNGLRNMVNQSPTPASWAPR